MMGRLPNSPNSRYESPFFPCNLEHLLMAFLRYSWALLIGASVLSWCAREQSVFLDCGGPLESTTGSIGAWTYCTLTGRTAHSAVEPLGWESG